MLLEFMLSEYELKKKFPKGTEITEDGEIFVSTGKIVPPKKSTCFASFPKVEFVKKSKYLLMSGE